MADTIHLFESPESATDINPYCSMIQARYSAYGMDCMRGFIVLEIRLLKSTAGLQHEYLSIEVLGPNDKTFYLAIERVRDDSNHNAAAPTKKRSQFKRLVTSLSSSRSLPPSPSTPSSILDSSLSSHYATDKVSRLDLFQGKQDVRDQVHRTLSFPEPSSLDPSPSSSSATPSPQPLCLYELVILAKTIHDCNQQYHLFNNNCHFFAGTIFKMVEVLYDCKSSVETRGQKASKGQKQAGTWRWIELYNDEQVDAALLTPLFKENLEAFEQPVREFDEERKAKDRQLKAQAHLKLQLEKALGLTSAA